MSPGPVFINRELSWLAFNRRVLEEALEVQLPLLERLKFLAITGSNMDEFFMVRVGGLQQLRAQADDKVDASGLVPSKQLAAISQAAHEMVADQYACLLSDIEPKLAAEGIRRLKISELTPDQDSYVERLFEHEIYPLISPMAVDLDDPFPLLPGLGVNLCIRLKTIKGSDIPRFAVVAIPKGLARFVTVPTEEGYHYLLLEDIITAFINRAFPGEQLVETVPFRITRNADMSVREDMAGDLLEQMKEVLTERRQSSCVRLEVSASASDVLRSFLKTALELEDADIYAVGGPIALSAYLRLAGMTGFENLRPEPWPPQPSPALRPNESIFESIARGDILLYHPYESFDPVLRLIEEAADDPDVLAIKQILYRTSDHSPVVAALARAADRDKNVTVVVELKARFDEARNIEWATALEHAGVQVIYGIRGLKTHAKICIVVRREPAGIRRYIHFGTGNYNEKTARLYSDISFMTCNEDFGADASAFFNTITGYSQPIRFRKIEVAPIGLRARILELIENERERCRQGHVARIDVKLNSLADTEIIRALYAASQTGVKIRLNVRGICCLQPGIPELSENITVTSIVDRFLEHSRIMYFHNGGDAQVYISSADWMSRNLDRRVELLVPVEDRACRERLVQILDVCFRDNVKACVLGSEGRYERRKASSPGRAVRGQEVLYRQARTAAQSAKQDSRATFEPQRPAETPP